MRPNTSKKKLEEYIGLGMIMTDVVTAPHVQKLSVTLDRGDPMPQKGDPVPPGWHHIFFPRLVMSKDLGVDGMVSEIDGGPDVPLPLRMFASSAARYHQSLRVGEEITQERKLTAVSQKEGRSGKLVFITYSHTISSPRGVCIEDDWNLVFLEDDPEGLRGPPPAIPGPAKVDWERVINIDDAMLFRFSAVTFNPHRIHYNHPYTTVTEGYPGLVVHGPLIATLLHELARENMPGREMTSFNMKASAPLFAHQDIRLVGKLVDEGSACELFALTPQGSVAMQAEAQFK